MRKIARSFLGSAPKDSRISSRHANFLHASSSPRKGRGGRREAEGGVNTFPFGAVGGSEGEGGGRFIRRNSGRNLMQINAGRRGCGAAVRGGNVVDRSS